MVTQERRGKISEPERVLSHPTGSTPLAVGGPTMSEQSIPAQPFFQPFARGTHGCEMCGGNITKNGNRFCSVRCRNMRNNAVGRKPKTFEACAVCGKDIHVVATYRRRGARHNRCCSRQCAGIFRARFKPSARIELACERCGKVFKAFPCHVSRGQGRFCSRLCVDGGRRASETGTRRKTEESGSVNGPCQVCGGFIFSKEKRTFCSRQCSAIARGKEKPMAKCMACGKEYSVPAGCKGIVCSMKCLGAVRTKLSPGTSTPRGKGGRREDLGGLYVRSRWEANWARYLNWLKGLGEIQEWAYEPDTFEFVGIRKGTRFYTPDFRVINKDGSKEYHEVKGWLTGIGKTKLKRMAKYHPDVKIVLVDKSYYKSVAKKVAGCIPNWERCSSHGL